MKINLFQDDVNGSINVSNSFSNQQHLKSSDRKSKKRQGGKREEVNIDEIYTSWSRWSRCSRRCKQRRERRCSNPDVCGSAVIKMERGCHSEMCRGRDFHIVRKKKKLGRKTKHHMKRNRAFYSKWTQWSQCTDMCLTTRVKSCRFKSVCGDIQVTFSMKLRYKYGPQGRDVP